MMMTKEELKEDVLQRIKKAQDNTFGFQIRKITYPNPRETIKHLAPSLLFK